MEKHLRITRPVGLISLILLFITVRPAYALDCGRPADFAEHTVCTSPQLSWLDGVYHDTFHSLVMKDPQQTGKYISLLANSVEHCTNSSCLRDAYLSDIGALYGTNRLFDWSGIWWNTSVLPGKSGRIQIGNQNSWGFHMHGIVQEGIYHSVFDGETRLHSGVGFSNKIAWGGDCAIMLIPLPDGRLKVSSDTRSSCSLLLPGKMSIDGIYTRSDSDPRPRATLLNLGILPDRATDEAFRRLVGNDYQKYVNTATDFTYSDEIDNMGATVVSMWMEGMANRRAAIIMTTPHGQIWALRVEPASTGSGVILHYSTTEADKTRMPKTLTAWHARFIKSAKN